MNLDLFNKIIDEIESYRAPFLRIIGEGESALHPQFGEMLRYASGKSIKIEVTTNGAIFNNYSYEEILSWDIDILGISVDGTDKESYHIIRKGGDYNSLRENVFGLFQARKTLNIKYPLIVIRNVLFPKTKSFQIESFKKTWIEVSDQITFNTFRSYNRVGKLDTSEGIRCKELFFEAHIRYDGSVVLCQHQFLFEPIQIIGNLEIQSLKDIWKSEKLHELRLKHQKNELPDACELCILNLKNPNTIDNGRSHNLVKNKLIRLANRIVKLT